MAQLDSIRIKQRATRETRNRELPVRLERIHPSIYLRWSERLFAVLLISLPFDLVIARFAFEITPERKYLIDNVIAITAAVAALGLFRQSLMDRLADLKSVRERWLRKLGTRLPVVFLGFVALIAIVELLARAQSEHLGAIVTGLLVMAGAIASAVKSLKDKASFDLEVLQDPLVGLEYANLNNALLTIVPLVCARLISLLAAFNAGVAYWPPFCIASLLLILALRPQRGDFLATCSRCACWTSRALKGAGYCNLCGRERLLPASPKQPSDLASMPADQDAPGGASAVSPHEIFARSLRNIGGQLRDQARAFRSRRR